MKITTCVKIIFELVTESEDICIVERLFSSSLVAVVSLSSPRKLRVCHFKKGNEICNYSYSNTILGVKLNRAVSIMFISFKCICNEINYYLLFSAEISCMPRGIFVYTQYT